LPSSGPEFIVDQIFQNSRNNKQNAFYDCGFKRFHFCLLDFRDSCFASTQCKVYAPGETWSLAPFCGASKCVKLESGRLAEEVTDCGPVIDLKATPGCQLLKDEADPKAAFPACCPVYDCEEDTEVKYVKTPAQKKKEAASVGSAKQGAGTSVEN